MYFVIFKHKNYFQGFGCITCETLGEAKEAVQSLFNNGYREIKISQEVPMKMKLEIEI